MNIITRSLPETGHSIKTTVFENEAGTMRMGIVKTRYCIVEVMAVSADTSYGYACANFNGRYYQHNFDYNPTEQGLIRMAHRLMRKVIASIPEETYALHKPNGKRNSL